LKLEQGTLEPAVKDLFHGFIAVAPLKLDQADAEAAGGDLFHGFIAVAPLKQIP